MSEKDKLTCEVCKGYLVYISQGNKRKCEKCGHTQYITVLPQQPTNRQKIEQWARTAAIQQVKISSLVEILKEVAPIICSFVCPSVKKTDEDWIHAEICKKITDVLKKEDTNERPT